LAIKKKEKDNSENIIRVKKKNCSRKSPRYQARKSSSTKPKRGKHVQCSGRGKREIAEFQLCRLQKKKSWGIHRLVSNRLRGKGKSFRPSTFVEEKKKEKASPPCLKLPSPILAIAKKKKKVALSNFGSLVRKKIKKKGRGQTSADPPVP